MNPDELLPCPFCGHAPFHRPKVNDGRWITDCNTVTCIRPTTGLCRTEAEAVTAWNTRATDHHDEAEAYRNRCERAEAEATELREENARLREALAKAGPIHAGPVGGELGRKYPDARQCVIEFAPEQASGAYDLHEALARIRAALGKQESQ